MRCGSMCDAALYADFGVPRLFKLGTRWVATYKIQTVVCANLRRSVRVPQLYLYVRTVNLRRTSGGYTGSLYKVILIHQLSIQYFN